MSIKIAWASDIHLNFCEDLHAEEFLKRAASLADVLVVTGDIAEAQNLQKYLNLLEELPDTKTHYVLGNHDFYGSSMLVTTGETAEADATRKNAKWLTMEGVVPLSPTIALIGNEGWYDGLNGTFMRSDVVLADFAYIKEMRIRRGDKPAILEGLVSITTVYAEDVTSKLRTALERGFEHVVYATHVPPYAGAAWHLGQVSDPDHLPFFSNRLIGEALDSVMADYPDRKLTVLCGHSHSEGVFRPRPNIAVHTAPAEYYRPTARLWELT